MTTHPEPSHNPVYGGPAGPVYSGSSGPIYSGPAPAPAPAAKKPRRTLVTALAVAGGLLTLCCAGSVAVALGGDGKDQTAASAPVTTAAAGRATAAAETRAAAPTTPVETTAAPPAVPKDKVYSGRGDKVIKLTLGDDPWIATITHRGNSNFAVHSIDSGGEDIDLLVNEIGNYNGTVPLNLTTNADDLRALTINADGSWKVVVKAAQKATRFTGTNSGKGPDVLVIPTGTLPDFATATITHKGRSNFVMRTYGSGVDLLVNEIGAYRGQIIIPNDTIIIEIQADGTWTIKLDK